MQFLVIILKLEILYRAAIIFLNTPMDLKELFWNPQVKNVVRLRIISIDNYLIITHTSKLNLMKKFATPQPRSTSTPLD